MLFTTHGTVITKSVFFCSFTREKELADVKINPTDVEIIANELEVPSET
jgi:hypothetical protein